MTKYHTAEERRVAINERNKQYYQDNKEKLKEYSIMRYQTVSQVKERQLSQQRKRYSEDADYKQKQKNFNKNKIEGLKERIKELESA